MSTATAPATRPTTPAPRRAPAPPRPDLRVLPAQPFRAPRGPFVLAVGAVLTIGLLGVLLLNTVVAQDAFTVSALQQKSAALADQEQVLTQAVAAADSPQRLESRARSLGMVPSENPGFLRLADGKVLGKPVPGKAPVVKKAVVKKPADTTKPATTTGQPVTPNAVKTKAAAATTPTAVKTKAARARAGAGQ